MISITAFFLYLYNQIRSWDAAKRMGSVAALPKELGNWNEVADFYRRASGLWSVRWVWEMTACLRFRLVQCVGGHCFYSSVPLYTETFDSA
ncbi:hypothetical protein TB1_035608 [Malus domestica]